MLLVLDTIGLSLLAAKLLNLSKESGKQWEGIFLSTISFKDDCLLDPVGLHVVNIVAMLAKLSSNKQC